MSLRSCRGPQRSARRFGNSVLVLLAYYSGVMPGDEDAGNALLASAFG